MMSAGSEYPAIAFDDVPLYVGRPLSAKEDGDLSRPHLHHHYEIFWLANGQGHFFHDFQTYRLTAGSLLFIAPGQIHHLYGDWQSLDFYVIGFSRTIFSLAGGDAGMLAEMPFFEPSAAAVLPTTAVFHPTLNALFALAWQRLSPLLDLPLAERPHDVMLSYLTLILHEARAAFTAVYPHTVPTASSLLVRQFRNAVEQQYRQRTTINDYADLLGVTPNHLVRTVRQATGTPPAQIARERLLLEAKRQLIHSDQPLAALAEALAFNSTSQFSHWFRRMAGLSPQQFRQQQGHLLPPA